MNWKESERLIRHNIKVGMKLDSRTVLAGPDFQCWGYDYNGTPGFKIRIGTTTCIEIPFIMLQTVYSDAIANKRTYENKVFKNKYERQLKSHGCHVHVIGRLFEKVGVATQVNKRKFMIL